jgi:hypothetical protein
MADSVIGALRVILGLDTAAFSQGAKDAQKTLDGLASTFKNVFAGLALGTVAYQFTKSIQGVIDAADQLGKASQKFGVPVEQLSGLKYAADLADVSFEALGKGLGKLSKAMLDGITNPAGQAAKEFQALGISLKDGEGNLKSTGDLFLDVSDKFSTLQDGAAKTALAIKLFGKAGADLIPLLNEGRGSIQAMQDQAAKLGVVISTDTAKKAQEFNDTLKQISAASQGLYLQIAAALLPTLQKLATAFLNSKTEGGFLTTIVNNLITDYDLYQIDYYAQSWENLVRVIKALKALPGDIKNLGFESAFENLNAVIELNRQKLEDLEKAYNNRNIFKGFLDNLNETIAGLKTAYGNVDLGAMQAKNAIDKFIETQSKSIASTQAQAAATGAAVGTFEGMRVTMEADAIALAEHITLTDAQRIALKNLADQSEAAAVALAGAKLTQEFLTPWDLYLQKLRDINKELDYHAISAATAAKAATKAAADMAEKYGMAAATAAGNFADFFKTFSKGNDTMFAISKAFSISQAIINSLVAATKAYAELGPILGPIAAAAAIAAGAAAVAKIAAEKPTAKMALGGSLMVKGAGGIDSQLVPIMATPGERVSVDQNKYGDSANGKTITVAGLKAKDYYRGDVLRDIIDNINEAIGDGYKLKVA